MALAPVITIVIHVGDVYYYTDRSRTTQNTINSESFNTASSVATYGGKLIVLPY